MHRYQQQHRLLYRPLRRHVYDGRQPPLPLALLQQRPRPGQGPPQRALTRLAPLPDQQQRLLEEKRWVEQQRA